MISTWRNRLKFALAGDVFEAVNPFIPGQPHQWIVQSVAESGPVRKVLELCAGTGYASRLLAQARDDVEVVGVDLSPEMVDVGTRKLRSTGVPNVSLLVGDIADLRFPENTFDAVMAVFGLHEVPSLTRRAAVAEAARVLKPGGLFATIDLDRPPGVAGLLADAYFAVMEPRHARQVCHDGIATLLTEAGFTIDRHSRAQGLGMTQTVLATL